MTAETEIAADVIIVGLGPVGATLANLLGRYGVSTLVVEADAQMARFPRAIALDNEALRILQMAGLGEGAFPTTVIPYVQMRSPIFGAYARGNTDGLVDGHPKLVTFYQPELEDALRSALESHACVRVMTGTRVTDVRDTGSEVRLTLASNGATRTAIAKYVVGCDGAASSVRSALGIAMQGESYPQDWLVVDTKNVSDAIEHVEFWCDPARPSPRMPAPGRRQRWEFMLQPGETSEEMQRESVARVLLRPWLGSHDVEIERIAVYRFQARIADRFSSGRVFLAGDAAHLTPPFAGQGLVSGLRDVANLAWKLAWVLRGHATTGILASYDVERRPHAKSTIELARFMGRMIMPSDIPTAFLVHGAMRVVDALPYTRRLFRDLEIKPKNAFERGLFTRSRGPLRAGASFPQARVNRGEREVWSDELLGDRISLVGRGTALDVPTDLRERWRARGGQILELELSSPPGAGAAVVRPDRVVMLQGRPAAATQLVQDALSLLTR